MQAENGEQKALHIYHGVQACSYDLVLVKSSGRPSGLEPGRIPDLKLACLKTFRTFVVSKAQ